MNAFLLLAAASTSTLVTTETPELERYKAIAPYVSPAPGQEVRVDERALRDRKKTDPMMLQGQIRISPPKGMCFTVTRNLDYPDDKICKTTNLSFKVKDLTPAGKLIWTIRTGPKDFGSPYEWQTPHRIAQVIPAGEKPDGGFIHVPISTCTAHSVDPEKRQIILELMSGQRWRIALPEKDVLLPQPASMPNLFLQKGAKGSPGTEKTDGESSDYVPKVEKGKPDDPVTKFWAMPERNSFTMNASNFKTSDTTPGMKGTCRYQFKDAPGDPESGWIECHETDYYDVVYTYLPCAKHIVTN
jgi:hypothetical protein